MTFTPRSAWHETPEPVRKAVAEALGAAIDRHADLHGGMSPGPAASLWLADGRHVFVKAVSAEVRAHNHTMILQEAAILDALPRSVPAPRRLATVECGPWAALATTWAAGATAPSWTDASIEAVADACRTTSRHRAPGSLPPVAQRIFDFDGWTRLAEIGANDDWEAAYAGPAADVVAGWENWTAGDALVHRDLRLDNTTFDADHSPAVLLDWAYAAAGAAWIDLAQLAADVVATGHVLGVQAATDRAYQLLRTLPPDAPRFVVGPAGMWCIRAATVSDTFNPRIASWRRARSTALRPLVARLIADFREGHRKGA
ncbi:phosphotransferase [Couchioplanes caeruleus]|uniref:phosphotransferase n=1 Tax=Couchioplanes caeruleus TaxID=56438 RepID=UPI0020BFA450|nr:phosphotransferase [Couchioplanes caeruleus]UQU61791.1 phosphotransferase [Couchioplanes caeruleus]